MQLRIIKYFISRFEFVPSEAEIEETSQKLDGDYEILASYFVQTSPTSGSKNADKKIDLTPVVNPQTTRLCERLSIDDPLMKIIDKTPTRSPPTFSSSDCTDITTDVSLNSTNPDEVSFGQLIIYSDDE